MVMTTDGYVVSPMFFPGGDIGSLAVNGTINDMAMAGANPLYMSASFIIEEGFPLRTSGASRSHGRASRAAGVPIITGDTKVVERGKADGVFISTTGVGVVPAWPCPSGEARPGDVVILSGTIGDHGVAVMSKRENLCSRPNRVRHARRFTGWSPGWLSGGPDIRLMRDPTRGGLSATLNEIAHQSGVGILIEEPAVPVAGSGGGLRTPWTRSAVCGQRGQARRLRRARGGQAVGGDARAPARAGRHHRRGDRRRASLRPDEDRPLGAGASSTGFRRAIAANLLSVMRILLLVHSFNSLAQRLHVELIERGHQVSVELDVNDAVTREGVALSDPDIVLAAFLKRAISEDVWRDRRCLIVHPGIIGDGGPSALDWAVLDGQREWGVTVLEAEAELDAGPVWASATFPMRAATKSSLYRREVTDAAVEAVLAAIARIQSGTFVPRRPDPADPHVRGRTRPVCRQSDRAIDWMNDTTEIVLRKIASADGTPGVRDELFGRAVRLYDAHCVDDLTGSPGALIARSGGALARSTRDGAIWIGYVREERERALKLPATHVFAAESASLPDGRRLCADPIRRGWAGGVPALCFLQWRDEHGPM